ncbi:hypothetical protein NC652_009070 [Populus alba x Populus x berolinensis]|nr:hypothetical protein NC652_009070 [Populus alba x Populus x berolinensis]
MNQSCSWDCCAGLFNSSSLRCCFKCTPW